MIAHLKWRGNEKFMDVRIKSKEHPNNPNVEILNIEIAHIPVRG